jgi:DGQHR domain-containing protein
MTTADTPNVILERRALRLEQPGGNVVYLFSLAPSEIFEVADVSRISRDDAGDLIGYQRPGVRPHVKDIASYLEGDDIVFPNALIMALDPDVRFRSSRGPKTGDGYATSGTLEITIRPDRKPGFIVDGQQRGLALRESGRDDLPVPIAAFVTDDVELQRDQFLRINNSKPLPRGLVTELLPEVTLPISPRMSANKLPSAIVDQLNRREDSPFHGMIRRPSATAAERREAVIQDTSLVKMLKQSLQTSSGCLFPFRNVATGEADLDAIWLIVTTYWSAVRDTFPEAWGRPPTESRLMHGAGIVAMGKLMDKIMASINPTRDDAFDQVMVELERIADVCRWTSGSWDDLDGLAWDEVQNLDRHVREVSNTLIRRYVTAKMAVV